MSTHKGYEFYERSDVPWTHQPPTPEDIARAGSEGKNAALDGRHFKTDCPYTFDKFKEMTYDEFNGTQRPMMNAWFRAWRDEQLRKRRHP